MSDRSFIETQFPIAPLSAESYKERKANLGQTLTRLGKWWGRKPLVLVRASVLGLLMPASEDPKKDREIFLKLMTMDPDGLWRRRKGKINDTEILKRAPEYKETWRATSKDERDELREEILGEPERRGPRCPRGEPTVQVHARGVRRAALRRAPGGVRAPRGD